VRDVRVVNFSLLTKWRWRLFDNNEAVWKEVIKSKYGNNAVGRVELGDDCKPWYASLWWKDICSVGTNLEINWFSRNVFKKLGNGGQTSFWSDIWIGEALLKERFPRLFSISSQKEAVVMDVRNQSVTEGSWRFLWRRRLFAWEEELLEELKETISQTVLTEDRDKWCWRPDSDAEFWVNSVYQLVLDLANLEVLSAHWHAVIFNSIWKSPTPSKACGFVWQLLHDRVPTRSNLVIRQIIAAGAESLCPLCGEESETVAHLFLYCKVALKMWMEIFAWLKVPFGLPHNLFSIFNCLLCAGEMKA
jgi:hypothetical protein